MKRITVGNRLTVLLLVICVLLAGILALEQHLASGAGTSTGVESGPPAAVEIDVAQNRYVAPEKRRFEEVLERPLFTPDRRPAPEPTVSAAPVTQANQIRLKLEGIAITSGTRVAIFRDLSNNQLLRLAEGMKHQGWLVEQVSSESAKLTRGEEIHELSLEPEAKATPRVMNRPGLGIRRR
jgi:hypothetical protein